MAEEKNIDPLVSMQQEICDMWGINNQTKYVFYYDESRGIVGVNIPNSVMEHMYEVFMESHAYSYKAVNKYNIPYAMLRYQETISIYHTFLFDSPMSEIVKEKINNNSKYFEILDKEIKRKVSGGYNLGIYLTKYQKKEHKRYIHMVVYEVGGYGKESRNIILEEKIEMKSWIYT